MDPLARQVVHVGVNPEERTSCDTQRELLPQLPPKRVPRMFPELHLASGEFPLSGKRSVVGPTEKEDSVPRGQKGHRDETRDVHGRREAICDP